MAFYVKSARRSPRRVAKKLLEGAHRQGAAAQVALEMVATQLPEYGELRLFLEAQGKPVSETWLYRWTP